MKTGIKIFGICIFIGLAIVAFATAMTFVVMQLWNWLMPDLFHLTTITFCQALGILVLSRILFGSFKFGKGRCCGGHGHHGGGGWFKNKMRKRFEGKLANMTPEEREQFRKNFLWSCCPGDIKGGCEDNGATSTEEKKD
jgi:hypothetical protein